MPQLIIHYSDNIDIPKRWQPVLHKIHRGIAETAGIDVMKCKGRAIRVSDYAVGDQSSGQAFANLQITIFEGHAESVLRKIGANSLDILKDSISTELECQITVEVRTMSRKRYFKSHQTSMR